MNVLLVTLLITVLLGGKKAPAPKHPPRTLTSKAIMTRFNKVKKSTTKKACIDDLNRLEGHHNELFESAGSAEVAHGRSLTRELTFGATPFTQREYMRNAADGKPDIHIPSRTFEYKSVNIEPFPQHARIGSHGSQVVSLPLAQRVNDVLTDLWRRVEGSYDRLGMEDRTDELAAWSQRWNKLPSERAVARIEQVAQEEMLAPILAKDATRVMVTFDDLDRTKMRIYLCPSTTIIRSKELNPDSKAAFTHIDFDHRHDYRQYLTHGDFSYSGLLTQPGRPGTPGGGLGYAYRAAYEQLRWAHSDDQSVDVAELETELCDGMLQYTNVWMAARGSDETFLTHLNTKSMRRSTDLSAYPLFVGSATRQLNLQMITPRSDHQWGYHAPLKHDQAVIWPTEETPHTAIRGDVNAKQKRLSAELRALSIVVDIQEQASIYHAASLLCKIRHPNYRKVFIDIPEAIRFIKDAYVHNTSFRG